MSMPKKVGILFWVVAAVFCAQTQRSAAVMGSPTVPQTIQAPDQPARSVLFCEIRGTIDPASGHYLRACIAEATKASAEALVVELDTPGGLVSSVKDMAQAIDDSQVPVIIYVTPGGASATSAGALLSLASHLSAMAPGTHIGAAHPVDSEGKDIKGAMGEKALNDTAAFARGLAELRGRNRELAEAVVSKSKSLTAQEALNQGLVDVLASSRAELLQKIDGRRFDLRGGMKLVIRSEGASPKELKMTWGQRLLHAIANPNIATLLMGLGVLAIYVEMTTPGAIIPGIVGVISLLTAFMAFQMLPIRMGGFLLLLVGVVLMIAEPFIVSSGALAIGGVISFILGLLWVLDPSESSLSISIWVWAPVVLTLLGASLVFTVAAARIKKLTQKTLAQMGGGEALGLSGYQGVVETVSEDGLSGKVHIRGEIWDFQCDQPVHPGDRVDVKSAVKMKVVVQVARKQKD